MSGAQERTHAALREQGVGQGCGCRRWLLLSLLPIALVGVVLSHLLWLVDDLWFNDSAPSTVERVEAPPAPSARSSAAADRGVEASPSPAAGRRMLRVERGMIVRQMPDSAAPSLQILDAPALLEILAQQGPWYRLDLGTRGAAEATTGWLRVEDGADRELRLRAVWQVPRPSNEVDPARLQLARQHLEGGGRAARCGPYDLLTDVADAAVLAACRRLAEALDATYAERYGVRPMGQAAETIILFERLASFRKFVQAEGVASLGYAGHANAAGGYLVLYNEGQSVDELSVTLVHELTHLVNWRALGGPLPRWLSEGLADGLGDTADAQGIAAPRGLRGLEAEAQRVRRAPGGVPSSEALARLQPQDFDAHIDDRHYEHSALLVRFFLVDATLAPRFRGFLAELAAGQPYDAERLRQRLGVSWHELDGRFAEWLRD